MNAVPDLYDVKTSDGLACFWTISYALTPLAGSVGDGDAEDRLLHNSVYAICAHHPTVVEAAKAVPEDEQSRVVSLQVKAIHRAHFGELFYSRAPFIDLHRGAVGPLNIEQQVLHTRDLR